MTEANQQPPKPEEKRAVETAVLLILRDDGTCLPVTDLRAIGVEVSRQATMNDVFRMTADVNDQISGVRVFGEVSRFMRVFYDKATTPEALAGMMARLAEGAVPAKAVDE